MEGLMMHSTERLQIPDCRSIDFIYLFFFFTVCRQRRGTLQWPSDIMPFSRCCDPVKDREAVCIGDETKRTDAAEPGQDSFIQKCLISALIHDVCSH